MVCEFGVPLMNFSKGLWCCSVFSLVLTPLGNLKETDVKCFLDLPLLKSDFKMCFSFIVAQLLCGASSIFGILKSV